MNILRLIKKVIWERYLKKHNGLLYNSLALSEGVEKLKPNK